MNGLLGALVLVLQLLLVLEVLCIRLKFSKLHKEAPEHAAIESDQAQTNDRENESSSGEQQRHGLLASESLLFLICVEDNRDAPDYDESQAREIILPVESFAKDEYCQDHCNDDSKAGAARHKGQIQKWEQTQVHHHTGYHDSHAKNEATRAVGLGLSAIFILILVQLVFRRDASPAK